MIFEYKILEVKFKFKFCFPLGETRHKDIPQYSPAVVREAILIVSWLQKMYKRSQVGVIKRNFR